MCLRAGTCICFELVRDTNLRLPWNLLRGADTKGYCAQSMCLHAQHELPLAQAASLAQFNNIVSLQVVNRAARGGRGVSAPPPAAHVDAHAPEAPANAVVADLGEGLEVLHLFTGRPVCALTLPAPGLHADVNGDGVLDHVYVRPQALAPAVCLGMRQINQAHVNWACAVRAGGASAQGCGGQAGSSCAWSQAPSGCGVVATSDTRWSPVGTLSQLKVMTLPCCVQF